MHRVVDYLPLAPVNLARARAVSRKVRSAVNRRVSAPTEVRRLVANRAAHAGRSRASELENVYRALNNAGILGNVGMYNKAANLRNTYSYLGNDERIMKLMGKYDKSLLGYLKKRLRNARNVRTVR
jgi:hypothetical protein